MAIVMYCPKKSRSGGSCDVIVCLFSCSHSTKIKCEEYAKRWPEIEKFPIATKYIDKYGEPDRAVPILHRRRQPRRS